MKLTNREKIYIGHVLDGLSHYPDNHFHCIVTSPPYLWQRTYVDKDTKTQYYPVTWGGDMDCEHEWDEARARRKTKRRVNPDESRHGHTCKVCGAWSGELGLEPTPEMFVEHMTAVLKQLHRVLRPDGTLWMNMGDTYIGDVTYNAVLQQKNIAQIPAKLALSMQGYVVAPARQVDRLTESILDAMRAGLSVDAEAKIHELRTVLGVSCVNAPYIVRNDLVWHKPNVMPESADDRFVKAHEYIYLATKQQDYFFDIENIREEYTTPLNRWGGEKFEGVDSEWERTLGRKQFRGQDVRPNNGRNPRSVLSILAGKQMKKNAHDHFATFPDEIPAMAIKAGTSDYGCCVECETPWERVMIGSNPHAFNLRVEDRRRGSTGKKYPFFNHASDEEMSRRKKGMNSAQDAKKQTIGWMPRCECGGHTPTIQHLPEYYYKKWPAVKPCRVLDPFLGSGTTAHVAIRLKRDWRGIEISRKYVMRNILPTLDADLFA